MSTIRRSATAAILLTLTLAACGGTTSSSTPSSSTTAAPTSTIPPTTSTTVHVPTDHELNVEWADTAIADSDALLTAFTAMSDAAGAYDMDGVRAACAGLLTPAQAYGDHAPATEAGTHARAASALYVRAATACVGGDLDSAIALMTAAQSEVDAATAAIR